MLEAQALTYSVAGQRRVDTVSLSVRPGEVTVVLGPNGAGKSTLLALLSGLLRPDSGQVRIEGRDPARLSARELGTLRAVVEQSPGWQSGLSAAELVMMGGYLAATAADWHTAMQLAHCEEFAARRLETLSGGERQRVHLARALLQLLSSTAPNRYLLLDEPTAALDFGFADAMMADIRLFAAQYGIGVLAVIHDINLALRHADTVLLMANGAGAAFGTTAEVMEKGRLEAIYGVQLAELVSRETPLRAFVPLGHGSAPH
jgi:iron complex transport system ATP-binding protein